MSARSRAYASTDVTASAESYTSTIMLLDLGG
jgi:hypothetical protein